MAPNMTVSREVGRLWRLRSGVSALGLNFQPTPGSGTGTQSKKTGWLQGRAQGNVFGFS